MPIAEIKRLRDEEKFIITRSQGEITVDPQVVEAIIRLGVYDKCLSILRKNESR